MAGMMAIDAESSMRTLADMGLKAIDLFRRVEEALKDRADDAWPEDLFTAEYQRFELWAANMGLFVGGHGSLDYRVREAEKLAETLRKFMQDLMNSLDDVAQMCSDASEESASGLAQASGEESATQAQDAEAADDVENEDEESVDMELLVDSVRDPINRLFKISTKIRNPSTRLGSSRAANYRQVDEETGVDLLQATKQFDLDYVKSVFLQYRKTKALRESTSAQSQGGTPGGNDDEVWEPIKTVLARERERENTGANSYLIERIAQANFRRRQQFAYWAKHREKLDKHTKAYQAQKGQLATAERHRGRGLGLEPAPGPLPSISSATRLDTAQLDVSTDTRSNWTFSEYSPSTRQASDTPVDFPPPPKPQRKAQTDNSFECPYCFFLCPKDMLAEKAWKAHLIHDMRPYICTYEECKNPTQLYDSRKDWVQHENSEHRRVWRCPEHSSKVFESLETYKRHLQERHGGSIRGEALTRIGQASESVADIAKRTCPICTSELDAGRSMEGHIALHLERFASFSLPRSTSNDDDGSNADSGKANRADEEGSRDDDFEGAFESHSRTDSSEDQSIGRPPKVDSSTAPHGPEPTGNTPRDLLVPEDEDESSSDTSDSRSAVEQPAEDWLTVDGLKVGEWCTDFEKYEKVERQFRETLEETERRLGSDHPETLDRMDELYDLLDGQMKFKEAEYISRRMLELKEKMLGHKHPEVMNWMNNVGHTVYGQGRYVEAAELHREVLAMREKELGREHIDTLMSLSNLAVSLSESGRFHEAEKLGREALDSRRKVLGPAAVDTLTSVEILGSILEGLNRLEEAERLEREALESRKKVLEPSHVDTLRSLSSLAVKLLKLGRLEEAENLAREALESRKKILGPSHTSTLASTNNLAGILERLGQLEEAKRLLAEVLEIRKQELGPDHRLTLTSIAKMAHLFWTQGKVDDAAKLYMEILEASKQSQGSTHPFTLMSMYNLAFTWHSQGRLGEATDLMEECVQLRRQVLGLEHEHTLLSIKTLEAWRAEPEQVNP